jgi:hypothetical protein
MSSIAIVSRIWASVAGPTLPRAETVRPVETASRCWHWTADLTVRPLCASGSIVISAWNPRTVEVDRSVRDCPPTALISRPA